MTNRKKSQTQEKSVAKQLSGRVTAASGATDFAKGDVRTDIFLVECKTTEKSTYTFKFSTWDKIYREALKDGMRIPLMCVDIRGERCFVCETMLLATLFSSDPSLEHRALYEIEDTHKQRSICGEVDFIVFLYKNIKHELVVVPERLFLEYVLPNIGG